MKNKSTVVIVVLALLLVTFAVILVPEVFPKNSGNLSQSSEPTIITSSPKIYTLEEMINDSDNVISGTVIKADVDEKGVLYTLTVRWKDVLKGRNYATMGYAYVEGTQTLTLNETYLFIGDTNEEKYHYKEPFENAPWVFRVNEDKTLSHISNGKANLVSDLGNISLETVKTLCTKSISSK